MPRYRMEDNTLVDIDKATAHYEEATDWNGSNHISRATGSQWNHQMLYRSAKGRYYVVFTSQMEGTMPRAEWLTAQDAARWLLHNDHELPEELQQFADEVSE